LPFFAFIGRVTAITAANPSAHWSSQIWRSPGELPGEMDECQIVLRFERLFTDAVLLEMVKLAKADRPFVRWL
jgi:hypothetical protein